MFSLIWICISVFSVVVGYFFGNDYSESFLAIAIAVPLCIATVIAVDNLRGWKEYFKYIGSFIVGAIALIVFLNWITMGYIGAIIQLSTLVLALFLDFSGKGKGFVKNLLKKKG